MLSRILFYVFILPLSYLPLKVLYGFSGSLSFVAGRLFGYRKKVIDDNLRHAFPDYSQKQRDEIRNAFYSHFCDLIVETVKTLTISKKELDQRLIITNPELLEGEEFKGKHLVFLSTHFGNWEWGALQLSSFGASRKAFGIYLPLNNKFFNGVLIRSRVRFGTHLISTKELPRMMERVTDLPSSFAFIADQNPSNLNKTKWVNFFGREVPVSKGPEHYARVLNAPVFFGNVRKTERGKYTLTYELMTSDISSMQEGLLLEQFMNRAEMQIRNKPEHWLWSHKRWKHKKKTV